MNEPMGSPSPMPRALAAALNVADLRRLARRRLPRALFDFVDGGAEDEVALRDNRDQFARWSLVGRVGIDVARRSTAVELFGQAYGAPIVVSATGMVGLLRARAELYLARGAHRLGLPFMLSTVSTVSIEDVAAGAPGPLWFQLYLFRDRSLSARLVARARDAGYGVLVLTLDCAVAGGRERDSRNGLVVPLRPTLANALDTLRRGRWLLDLARHGPPRPENLVESADGRTTGQALTAYMQAQLDPTVTWDDVRWVRGLWDGPLVIKGILAPEDARHAIEAGVDGIIVSNHGGRQLDGAVPTLDALTRVAEVVGGRAVLLCDGGATRGTHVLTALALGARAVSMGRTPLYGLAAGGEEGVVRALDLVRHELDRAMALTGCRHVGEIGPSCIVARGSDR